MFGELISIWCKITLTFQFLGAHVHCHHLFPYRPLSVLSSNFLAMVRNSKCMRGSTLNSTWMSQTSVQTTVSGVELRIDYVNCSFDGDFFPQCHTTRHVASVVKYLSTIALTVVMRAMTLQDKYSTCVLAVYTRTFLQLRNLKHVTFNLCR